MQNAGMQNTSINSDRMAARSRESKSAGLRVGQFVLTGSDVLVAVLLILTMMLAGYFRLTGMNWDDFVRWHPDERFLTDTASRIHEGWLDFTPNETQEQQLADCVAKYPNTSGVGGFFDTRCSDMNPHNVDKGLYVYGTMPLFIARWTGEAVNQITGTTQWTDYGSIQLVWRYISAICDLLVVLVVFLTGAKLHSKWVGLLAAVLYAGAVLPIQLGHFGTADAMTTLWVAVTIYFVARIQIHGTWLDYALAGAAFGASLASRFNVLPLVVAIMFVAGVRMLPFFDTSLPWSERNRALTRHFSGLVLAGVTTLLIFRIFNPYAFVGPGFFGLIPNTRWLEDLGRAREMTSVDESSPPAWQWVGRPAYLFAWWNMVMWGMGLALGLTGWIAWVWSGWQFLRGRAAGLKNAAMFLWILVYFGWVGGNHVMSMRYYLPLYPMLTVLAAWMLVELVKRAGKIELPSRQRVMRLVSVSLLATVAGLTLLWGAMFTNIYRHMATYTQASHWFWENVPGDFSMRLDGSDPDTVPLINIPLGNSGGTQNDMLSKATMIVPGQKLSFTFTAPADGTVSNIYAPRIGVQQEGNTESSALHFTMTPEGGDQMLIDTVFTAQFPYRGDQVGDAYTIPLSEPVKLEFGKRYIFYVEVTVGSPIVTGGTIVARDGGWEEVAPPDICLLPAGVTLASDPPSGLVDNKGCQRLAPLGTQLLGYDFNNEWEDLPEKRTEMQRILDGTDYIVIATNRRYDSQARIPLRWPMTMRYYDALFSGELGFDLVKNFQETFELGPLRVSDQYLPIYQNSPKWLNELEAEEAFSVYDHPAVMVFKKGANYSPEKTREILYSIPLDRASGAGFVSGDKYNDPELLGVVTWDESRADQAPTQLMMTDDMRATQYDGGTWSQRFDRTSPINQNQVLAVVVWWLALMLFGFVMFPLMFVIAPGLADRGYAISKFAGVLLVAWMGWFAASARIAVWSPEGLRLILLLLAAVSAFVTFRVRAKLFAFIRTHWRMLLAIDAITLVLFLVFIGVRLTNPDLWTSGFGGEKPMDYAYFNGVLRSTIFPAIDPWFAGGYINYYYFGFVIVAVPTLFTGILPSIAYNLILPMLFAMTGIGAFAVAFSVVHARTERRQTEGAIVRTPVTARQRLGSPWIAGIVALLLAVVLGNLDTPRTFFTGVARIGGYSDVGEFSDFLIDDFRIQKGSDPQGDELAQLFERAQHPSIGDSVRYQLAVAGNILTSIGRGMGSLLSGQTTLAISPDRWFWGPSRVIGEPNSDTTITEMPIFTYVYGDMHGHMIAMPLMLLIVAMVLNELLLAGRERRWFWSRLFGLFMVALPVGLTIANNSWDYPTFTLFGALGLGYAWWLNWRRISRISLLSMVVRLSTFFILSYLVAIPFRTWFSATYSSVRFWDGKQTALWQYLSVHGLFLFLLVSMLVWETGRWLRSMRVRDLRGKQRLLLALVVIFGGGVLGAIIATLIDYQVALIVVPLVLWIAVLFFRPGQSVPMQFVLVLAGLALSLTLAVELVTLEGDIGRQNTVFKFYIQVWLLFSVVAGVAAAWLFQSSERWSRVGQALWYLPLALLFFVAGLYPIMAVRGKAEYRLPSRETLASLPPTLDGDDFMKYVHNYTYDNYPMPMDLTVDAQIIQWLQDHVEGSPVILEGISEGVLYKWGGRISIHTGLPSVIGWDWHQKQQRTFDPLPQLVEHRLANVNYFYNTTDLEQAWRILQNYDVSYVIVGALENSRYADNVYRGPGDIPVPPGGLAKFDEMVQRGWLEPVYEAPSLPLDDGTPRPSGKIYRVVKDAAPGIYVADSTIQGGN